MRIGLVLGGQHLHPPLSPRDRLVKIWAEASPHQFTLIHRAYSSKVRRALTEPFFLSNASRVHMSRMPSRLPRRHPVTEKLNLWARREMKFIEETAIRDELQALLWLRDDWTPFSVFAGDCETRFLPRVVRFLGEIPLMTLPWFFDGDTCLAGDRRTGAAPPETGRGAVLASFADDQSEAADLAEEGLRDVLSRGLDCLLVTDAVRIESLDKMIRPSHWQKRIALLPLEPTDRLFSRLIMADYVVVVRSRRSEAGRPDKTGVVIRRIGGNGSASAEEIRDIGDSLADFLREQLIAQLDAAIFERCRT